MDNVVFWVPGVPVTFATAGESLWKRELETKLPAPTVKTFNGVRLKFILPTLTPHNHPVDIDNLCEPVFSVLVGKLGWFDTKRPNIKWWRATKVSGKPTGVKLVLETRSAPEMVKEFGQPFFIYHGAIPEKASDTVIPENIKPVKPLRKPQINDRYMVRLQFGGSKINIGDIATGKVKTIIDGLYPLIGGNPGAPEDWRIHVLQVEKGVTFVKEGYVFISIWRYHERDSA